MTRLLDDYVIAASAGVMAASVVILASFLIRYRKLVEEAEKSTNLAKDVWSSMNSRFSVVDTRIVDLMVRTEVLSSKLGVSSAPAQTRPVSSSVTTPAAQPSRAPQAVDTGSTAVVVAAGEGTETEARVLHLLVGGPKTSAEIKEQVGRSREHTARLMKAMFERGLVVRNDRHKPYVYEITDAGRSYMAS